MQILLGPFILKQDVQR